MPRRLAGAGFDHTLRAGACSSSMPLSSIVAAVRHPDRPAGRAFWRRAGYRIWRAALWLLLAAWCLGLLAWLTLHWNILPRLDEWRPQIEAQASRALGHPVSIGHIRVDSAGWVPSFVLSEVVLRDPLGRDALRLPQVSAALSVPSLLALRLRFDQLLIEGARLEVRRDAVGRWFVAGLDMASTEPGVDGALTADWFFEQHEFLIRGGTLRWVDEQRAAPPLQLSDVQLLVRNRGRRHELRLDATPPADWGARFTLVAQARGALLARAGDWQRWKGTLFAELPRADVSQLRRHVDLPVDLQQGEAALRAWVDWDQGVPLAATLDAALRGVSVRLAPDLEPVALAGLSGRFIAERQATGVRLAVERLTFATADGLAWAPSTLALQWRQVQAMGLATAPAAVLASAGAGAGSSSAITPAGPPVTGGEFSADRLDLALLAEVGERLPIGAGLRGLLRQLNPEGTVQALKASWDGPLDAPRRYTATARVKGLSIAAAASPEPGGIGRPGWRGADLDISATEAGGQAELVLADGAIELPGVFEQASVPLAHFSAQLQWRIEPGGPGTGAATSAASSPPAATRSARPAAAATSAPRDPLPRFELKVINARFDNADARGVLNAAWHTGAGTGFGKGGRLPGVLELSGSLAEGRATSVARYLPLGIGADTRHWVQRAVQGGTLRDVSYRVKGDLWDFPFVNRRDGEFRIAGRLQDVTLAPVPSVPAGGTEAAWESPWPAFTAVQGELLFERDSMSFQRTRGKLWGVELDEVQGRIRELSDHAVLEVEGQARGPAADLLRYLRGTPLAGWTGGALDATTASGVAELKLGLNIPLARTADTVVKASVVLPGNDLRLRPDLPPLLGARGRVDVTHRGVQVSALRGQVLGGETQIDGGSQADGSLRFAAVGNASADGLRRVVEPGSNLAKLAARLQGQAAYRLQIGLNLAVNGNLSSNPTGGPTGGQSGGATAAQGSNPGTGLQRGQTDWLLTSNLAGLAIDLPEPLRKATDSTLALRLSSAPEPRDPAASPPAAREWLRLELGPLKAAALIDSSPPATRLLRSAIAWDAPLPEPVAGGRAVLVLPRLDVDAWRSVFTGLRPGPGAPGAAALPVPEPGWLPQSVQLRTAELLAAGRRLTGLTLDLQRLAGAGDEGWRAQVVADQTAGALEYREPRRTGAEGRIRARLSHLTLPPAEADTVADSVAGLLDKSPTGVPSLDIEIDDFELRGRKLGRLAVEAVNRGGANDEPGPRGEWRLNRLQLNNPDARLIANGRWLVAPGSKQRRMALDFTLDIDNGGALLERLGFGRVVRGTKGRMTGALGWDGSPLALDLPTLNGTLGLALDGGQFLKVNPGAARLLGVLSLQALPRRLLLDFRDVFQEGFAFDNASGDVRISRGVASTANLRLRGVQALVLMEGSADIARETQDLNVVVVPELATGSASLAYAAINPAIGLGAFLGQWLLREPLRQASAREFHITGGWDDPKVERVQRNLLDPLPASAAPDAQGAAAKAAAAAAAPANAAAAPAPSATAAAPAAAAPAQPAATPPRSPP